MTYTYVIVDDEPFARKLVYAHTSKIERLLLVGECGDALETKQMLSSQRVDLLFLDIAMPEMDGLELLKTIKQPPCVIITTAFRKYAPEAFDLDVIDYLLKPISFERLLKAVNKFFDRKALAPAVSISQQDQKNFLYLKAAGKAHRIYVQDILYIESMDEYVKVYLQDGMIISRETITCLEQKLASNAFIRIHRSFLVSEKAVSCISLEGIEIRGKMLPFGGAYKQGALARLGFKTK